MLIAENFFTPNSQQEQKLLPLSFLALDIDEYMITMKVSPLGSIKLQAMTINKMELVSFRIHCY